MGADRNPRASSVAETEPEPGASRSKVLPAGRVATAAGQAEAAAFALAERLGLPYVDVSTFRVDPDLFRSIPVEWMLRYTFIPEKRTEKALTVICADPTDVVKLDELELLAGLPDRKSTRL